MKDRLPLGWTIKKLDEIIIDKITGEWGTESEGPGGVKVLKTTNFTNDGTINLEHVVYRAISKDIIQKKRLLYGDIILEKSGGSDNQPVGRVVFFDIDTKENYLCNNFTQILRINEAVAYPKFILYYLLDLHKRGITKRYQNKTTGIRNLQVTRYLDQEILIPPIETQKIIVSLLDKAAKCIQKRKESDELVDMYLQSVFIEMFGDPIANTKGWGIKTLESVCSIIYRYPTFYGLTYIKSGTPVVRIGNILKSGIVDPDLNNYVFIDEAINIKYPHTILELSDIVMAVRGDGSTAKRIGYVNSSNLVGANISPNLLRFKADIRVMDPSYMFHLLKSFGGQQLLDKYVNRTAKKNINARDIKRIKVPVPPIELQNEFAKITEKINKLKQKQKQSNEELSMLFKSLLQKTLRGELTSTEIIDEESFHTDEFNFDNFKEHIKVEFGKEHFRFKELSESINKRFKSIEYEEIKKNLFKALEEPFNGSQPFLAQILKQIPSNLDLSLQDKEINYLITDYLRRNNEIA